MPSTPQLLGQRLVGRDDLLDQEIAEPRRPLPETLEIGLRVAQPVDVIDAQPVDEAFLDQREDQRMRRLEDLRVLDPKRRRGR